MTTDEERQRTTIANQAAEWLIANRDDPDPARQARFAAWLRASPANAQAYSHALRVVGLVRQALPPAPPVAELLEPQHGGESNVLPFERARPAAPPLSARRRWPYALAAAVVPFIALLGVWVITHRAAPPLPVEPGLHFATSHGQQLTQMLADGSVLLLNTDTAVTVHLLATSRRVELEHGQVLFKVVHDPARPFQVSAGSAQVTDVGTQFDVYLQSEATVVTVLEGQVAVRPSASQAGSGMLVGAGEQVRVVHGELPAVAATVDPARSTAWLHRQISFRHEPLSHVIGEFNRYAATPIQLDSPTVGQLPVSGVFNVDDTESMVAFLRSLPGVKVEVGPSSIRVSGD